MNKQEMSQFLNSTRSDNPLMGRGYNDRLPREIPLRMKLTNCFVGKSKAGNDGVWVYLTDLDSGKFFTGFNSINEGYESFIDLQLDELGAEGETRGERIQDLATRQPIFEVEFFRNPKDPRFINARYLRVITARTTEIPDENGEVEHEKGRVDAKRVKNAIKEGMAKAS